MLCTTCNSTEFSLQDGVYFCIECSTQIQGSLDEKSALESFSKRTLLKSTTSERKKQVVSKKKVYSSWTTPEAYNIILNKQISALISLGASESLKKVVLSIWSQYLQKCEIAFRRDHNPDEDLPRLSAFPRNRDVKVLYGDKSSYQPKKFYRGKRIKRKQTTKKISQREKMEEDTTELEESTNDVYDPSSDTKEENTSLTEDNVPESQNTGITQLSSHAKTYKNAIGKQRLKKKNTFGKEICPHHMTLFKTLCFCYLGILYTEDQLLLSDILQFVNEGRIPYLNAGDCFPPTMKVQSNDHIYFYTNTTPDMHKIVLISAKLYDFLKLPKLRHRPLMPIVFRYVKDFNLPEGVVHIVKILLDKVKHNVWYETKKWFNGCNLAMPIYENQAMAAILVALKMLLVLDGNYEIEHSEVMTKINILLKGTDRKMFVWNNWRRQMQLKEFLFLKSGPESSGFSRIDSLSAELIMSRYHLASVRDQSEDKQNALHKRSMLAITDIMANLDPVKNTNASRFSMKPCSFPLKQRLSFLMKEWKNLPFYKETDNIDFTFLKEDFSSHLLYYQNNETTVESEDLIRLLLSSLYQSVDLVYCHTKHDSRETILRTTSKYWHRTFHKNMYISGVYLDKLPASFKWLLELLSKYISINHNYIYMEMLKIERQLFC